MFRTFFRTIRPNPFDRLLKQAAKKNKRTFLIEWNRGLGDIALGLYAIKERICQFIENPKIVFITRESLEEGFSFLEGVETIVSPTWERNKPYDAYDALQALKIDSKTFDVIIQKPDPTYWVKWQLRSLTPKLKWNPKHDLTDSKFSIDWAQKYIGVQLEIETNYNVWRDYPIEKYAELFDRIEKKTDRKILLFGKTKTHSFKGRHIIDLRGKTNLYELIFLIKKCCNHLILPDSGILSFVYYLDVAFPIHIISLWADPKQGILKQGVPSPNPQLTHTPIIGAHRDLSGIDPYKIYEHLGLS